MAADADSKHEERVEELLRIWLSNAPASKQTPRRGGDATASRKFGSTQQARLA